ncbi:MAG TPA: DUF4352 domain-containing protein [Bryobacteraceae bacterium]|nr:DUF4352 domain-containing protein [Bryobacteraceae bacterium]
MRPLQLILPVVFCATLVLSGCAPGPSGDSASTYNIGDKIEMGRLSYTVFDTQWLPQIGSGATARVPQYRYFLVRMSVANTGSGDAIAPNFTIEDDSGKSYSELSNGEDVPQWLGYLVQIKPAKSMAGNIVFDAPPKHYKLRVTDETGQHTALVDIPLSFGAQLPTEPASELGGGTPTPPASGELK